VKRSLTIAAVVIFVALGTGVFWWLGSGVAQVTVDEIGDQVQTVRRGEMPIFAATPEVAQLYRFATEHPEAFKGVECTCGCVLFGHFNNRQCYIKSVNPNQITYTSHAAT